MCLLFTPPNYLRPALESDEPEHLHLLFHLHTFLISNMISDVGFEWALFAVGNCNVCSVFRRSRGLASYLFYLGRGAGVRRGRGEHLLVEITNLISAYIRSAFFAKMCNGSAPNFIFR